MNKGICPLCNKPIMVFNVKKAIWECDFCGSENLDIGIIKEGLR